MDRSHCTARRHGTSSAYDYGCRCPDAREANRLRKKRGREGRLPPGRVSPIGTQRRLQALSAIGWSHLIIARELGMHPTRVRDLRGNQRTNNIYRTTAIKVARLYERLSGTPGPSDKVRVWAEKLGWAPPLAWEGLNIDDPNAQPQGVLRKVTKRELAWLREQKRVPAAVLVDLGDRMFVQLAQERGEEPTWAEVAEALGVTPNALDKARYRLARATRQDVA